MEKKATILTAIPYELLEELARVLGDIIDYNDFNLYGLYNSNLDGAKSVLDLKLLADSTYLSETRKRCLE